MSETSDGRPLEGWTSRTGAAPALSPESNTLAVGATAEGLPRLGELARHTVLRRMLLSPGATTGWHYHPGTLLVLVDRGVLTHRRPDGTARSIPAGTCFVETSGPDNGHEGVNLGSEHVLLYVLYFLPHGETPLAVNVPAPA